MRKHANFTYETVGTRLDIRGGEARYKAPKTDTCLYCGREFHPTTTQPVFCSYDCDMAFFRDRRQHANARADL